MDALVENRWSLNWTISKLAMLWLSYDNIWLVVKCYVSPMQVAMGNWSNSLVGFRTPCETLRLQLLSKENGGIWWKNWDVTYQKSKNSNVHIKWGATWTYQNLIQNKCSSLIHHWSNPKITWHIRSDRSGGWVTKLKHSAEFRWSCSQLGPWDPGMEGKHGLKKSASLLAEIPYFMIDWVDGYVLQHLS